MNIYRMLAAAVLAGNAWTALAQVNLACRPDHFRLLQYEALQATLMIENNLAQSLIIGGEQANARLSFDIMQIPGLPLPEKGAPVLRDVLTIAPQEKQALRVNLQSAYEVRAPGQYALQARLTVGDQAFVSSKDYFEIGPGFDLDSLSVGIPGGGTASLKYTLKTLYRDREDHIFVQIEKPGENQVLGTYDLGLIVRLFRVRIKADNQFQTHVLHQSGPARFTHSVFSPDGQLLRQEFYTGAVAMMNLSTAADGGLEVSGGELLKTE